MSFKEEWDVEVGNAPDGGNEGRGGSAELVGVVAAGNEAFRELVRSGLTPVADTGGGEGRIGDALWWPTPGTDVAMGASRGGRGRLDAA